MNRTTWLASIIAAFALVTAGCQTEESGEPAGVVILDLVADAALADLRTESGVGELARWRARPLRERGFIRSGEVVYGIGSSSWVEFESVAPRSRRLVIQGRPTSAVRKGEPEIDIALNGELIETLVLRKKSREYVVELPASAMRVGSNRLAFTYGGELRQDAAGSRRRFEWAALRLDDEAPPEAVAAANSPQDTLRLPYLVRHEYFERLPAGTRLLIDGVETWGIGRNSTLRLDVFAEGEQDPIAFEIRPNSAGPLELELNVAGGVSRIGLVALPGPGVDPLAGGIDIGSAEVRAVTPSGMDRRQDATGSDPTVAEGAAPNVILYLIDTLRADHLGVYGYPRPTSPRIDEFAADAITFDRLQAQSSWTKPVVATLLTGLLPQQHGVVGREDTIDPAARTLPTLLQLAGYQTSAFVTNSTVGSYFNFDIGFHYYEQLGERPTDEVHQLSDAVNESFFSWSSGREADRPFFAMLHTTDPHGPYVPRQPYRDRFAPDVKYPEVVRGAAVRVLAADDAQFDVERATSDLVGLYDAEIAFNDEQFGALLDQLRADGLYDSTLIILLSDHGEEFRDHGGWSHGNTLFQEQLHVPLLVKLPGQRLGGTRVDVGAQHIDVVPTILDVLGLEAPEPLPGTSLVDLADGTSATERPASSHLAMTANVREAMRWEHRKLVRATPASGDVTIRLYDLATDPRETASAVAEHPIVAGYLRTLIDRLGMLARGDSSSALALDPEMTEQLRALGYIR